MRDVAPCLRHWWCQDKYGNEYCKRCWKLKEKTNFCIVCNDTNCDACIQTKCCCGGHGGKPNIQIRRSQP